MGCNSLTTVTLGITVPTLGVDMFYSTTATVTVKVPTGVTGYDGGWGDGFRGGNTNTTVTIEKY
jgi:hypothetical protein